MDENPDSLLSFGEHAARRRVQGKGEREGGDSEGEKAAGDGPVTLETWSRILFGLHVREQEDILFVEWHAERWR
jgi:hypothetical protein